MRSRPEAPAAGRDARRDALGEVASVAWWQDAWQVVGRHLHHREEQVAKLVFKIVKIAALNRVDDLIGFLNCIGRNSREVLLKIPGTASHRSAQSRHNLDQILYVFSGFGGWHQVVFLVA